MSRDIGHMQTAMRLRWSVIFFLTMYAFMMVKANWISDPDIYWHIVVGRDIWTSAHVPMFDSYSFSALGKPWIAKEWLSQLILFAVYTIGGWSTVAFFACAICALSLTVLFWRLLALVKWTVAIGLVWIAMPFLSLSFLARPQMFSFLLFAIAILETEAAVASARRPAWWIVLLALLWANLHASFPILIVVLGFGALDAAAHAQSGQRVGVLKDWAVIAAAVMISFGCTPYFFGSLQVATTIVGADLSKYILEWRPIDWNYYRSTTTEALILGGWLAFITIGSLLILYRRQLWPFRFLPMLAFAALTMKHIRFCTLFTLMAVVTVARPFGERFPRFAPRPLSIGPDIMRRWRMALGLSLAIAGSTFSFIDRAPDTSMTPSAALAFARAMGAEGRVYNSYLFGGYLISEGVPTLIDGRTELFFGGPLETILDPIIAGDEIGFQRSLQIFGIQWALVKAGSSEAQLFAKTEHFKLIYQDRIAEIFVPNRQ